MCTTGIPACAGTRAQPCIHVHTHAHPVCAPRLTCPRDTRVYTQVRTHICAGSLSTPVHTPMHTHMPSRDAHTSSRVCGHGAHIAYCPQTLRLSHRGACPGLCTVVRTRQEHTCTARSHAHTQGMRARSASRPQRNALMLGTAGAVSGRVVCVLLTVGWADTQARRVRQ